MKSTKSMKRRPSGKTPRTLWIVVLSGAVALGAVGASKTFDPPRMAFVNISEIFEGYEKKKDKQTELEEQMKSLQTELGSLEKQYEEINQALQNLKEDSPLYLDKILGKKQIEVQVMQLRNTKLKELRGQQIAFLGELRKEITDEIEAYARLHRLDAVFEQEVAMDSEAGKVGFRWPIAHFVHDRLNITADIAAKLNAKYKKN